MKKLLTSILLLLIQYSLLSQKPVPELWGLHVHDEAHILSQQTVDNLERQLRAYEDSTSNQVAILIISSLSGEVLEDYSLRVAEKWKIGNKKKDNGILLLIAVDDHKMRIEAGEGLEGVLPDVICNRIIRNEIAPNFRKDDYDAGVQTGINAILKAVGGEYKSTDFSDGTSSIQATDLSLKERILIGVFIFGILGIFTFIGIFAQGCSGWFLYLFLIPFYTIFPMVILGVSGGLITVGIYAIAFPLLKIILGKTSWGKGIAKKMKSNNIKRRWSSGSGWIGGTGSGWSSGSNSSGGFSGGGGSFGGGGSSGSW